MRLRLFVALPLLLLAGICAYASVFTVDQAEYAYVTQFGRHVATFDGATEGGLHWKSPWQSVQRFDRRLQTFDLPESEQLTPDDADKTIDKTLTVVAYVSWRIADKEALDRFIRSINKPDRVATILGEHIRSRLGAAFGRMKMDDLFSVEPGKVEDTMEKVRYRLLLDPAAKSKEGPIFSTGLQVQARADYGIEIVDIRLRRTSHPEAVRAAIFNRIRSEREKKAADYLSAGKKSAQDIASAAERKAKEIVALARAEEKKLKGQAEAEADRIRNQAHAKDVEFYTFLKKLEEYQHILGDNKTVLLLSSSHRELFDLLFQPPQPGRSSVPRPLLALPATPADESLKNKDKQ